MMSEESAWVNNQYVAWYQRAILTHSLWVIVNQSFQGTQVSPFPFAKASITPLSTIIVWELHVTHSTRLAPNKPREKKVQRPNGDPWQPNLTPGKVISVTIRI